MNKKKIFIYLTFIFITYRFIDSLFWFHPYNVSNDSNTHWAYLAATTFDFIDPKWDFPKFVYGPWYYFYTAYIFGPPFFLAYYFNLLTVHEAAMYSFLCGNYILNIVFLLGTAKLAKKLFKSSGARNSYFLLVMLLPFANKNAYNYTVENLALAFMPWIIIYLFKAIKLNRIKYWLKLSFFLGLAATSKVSILIPCVILITGVFTVYVIKNKKILHNFLLPYIVLSLLVLTSNFITKSSLFVNYDAGNAERNYPGLKDNSVFYKVNIIDAFENPTYPNQKYSWFNMWSLDFFGDYFNAIKSRQRGENKEKNLNRISLIATLIFIPWYLLCLFKTVERQLFTYNNVISIFFFAMFFEQVAYCFYVFNPALSNSFDMRYWGFYIFFLIFPISKYIDSIENKRILKLNLFFVFFWCILSLNQMMMVFI